MSVVQRADDNFSLVGTPYILGRGKPGFVMRVEIANDEDVTLVAEQGRKFRYIPMWA